MIEYVINHKDSPEEMKFDSFDFEPSNTYDEKQEKEKRKIAQRKYFERLQKDLF